MWPLWLHHLCPHLGHPESRTTDNLSSKAAERMNYCSKVQPFLRPPAPKGYSLPGHSGQSRRTPPPPPSCAYIPTTRCSKGQKTEDSPRRRTRRQRPHLSARGSTGLAPRPRPAGTADRRVRGLVATSAPRPLMGPAPRGLGRRCARTSSCKGGSDR